MAKSGVDYPSWTTLFPAGRFIFYEGDDPDAFIAEIKEKFGFDPTKEAGADWRDEYKEFHAFGFFCPAEHLDAIYGSDDYPMGS